MTRSLTYPYRHNSFMSFRPRAVSVCPYSIAISLTPRLWRCYLLYLWQFPAFNCLPLGRSDTRHAVFLVFTKPRLLCLSIHRDESKVYNES